MWGASIVEHTGRGQSLRIRMNDRDLTFWSMSLRRGETGLASLLRASEATTEAGRSP